MYIKRHPQACFEIFKNETRIFIDPGYFGIPENLVEADAIFVTHSHFDHVDHKVLNKLLKKKKIPVFGPRKLQDDLDFKINIVKDGDSFSINDFRIDVMGSFQDVTSIHDEPIENVGYMIDRILLHPGDALPKIHGLYAVILPVVAPWVKHKEMEEYLEEYRPKIVIASHDITLNEIGIEFQFKSLEKAANRAGSTFFDMKVGSSRDLEEKL